MDNEQGNIIVGALQVGFLIGTVFGVLMLTCVVMLLKGNAIGLLPGIAAIMVIYAINWLSKQSANIKVDQ